MKNSLITGLLALSIITTVAPVDAATKHSTDKHLIQHVTQKKVKHKHYKHRLRQSRTENSMLGIASWYGYESGPRYRRRPKTASGAYFSPKELTAAHKSLPFGTVVEVTNLANNQTVLVTINDRGPTLKSRIIDLSRAAAVRLRFEKNGVTKVKLEIIS